MDGLESPGEAGLKDNADALAEAVEANRDEALAGEAVWRPYDEAGDTVVRPRGDKLAADQYRADARILTAALKVQFRRKFLQARDPREVHGVRRGRDLSERRLVESFIEIKSKTTPSRPDYKIEDKQNVSIAIAVVGDESGSMHGAPVKAAATAMVAVAEAFDNLNAPVMCCGPRNGNASGSVWRDQAENPDFEWDSTTYHRHDGSRIDLFKDWDESFKRCKDRFGAYTASGSTPLSDGVQYGLRALNERPERFRVMLVLTDGCPDCPKVVKRQIRLAAEAGIHVIGVGFAGGEYWVPQLFPRHVVVNDLQELPKKLLATLDSIVFPSRTRKTALDGNAKRRQRAS